MIEDQTSVKDWGAMLRLSKTHMQTYLMCPRKFYFQYVIAAPWEFTPASLPFGKALHAAVAFFYLTLKQSQVRPDLALVIAEFETQWRNETVDRDIAFQSSSRESMEGLGKALLKSFYDQIKPRRIEAVEYAFSVSIFDPDGGRPMDFKLVGIIDLIESDDEGNFIISELKTSSKRYADSQGENQLDGLIYAYALSQLGLRTTANRTLIRYDVLVKTKTPAFQQVYFNKEAGDYLRLARWIKEILQALDRGVFFPNFGWSCKQCQFRKTCWSL